MFGERYRVVSLLGSGGMGQVFRVEDQTSGQALALKVLRPLDGDDGDRVRRFQREIQILTRIQHPAVLRILDWGDSPAGLYFVTELVDGEDLKLAIRRRGPWPAAEAAALGATLADALAAAHAQGVVHRDVKPNNVMIARDGSVRLLDFGLARGAGIDLTTLTRTGTILGTPGYMSPEQFDAHGVDERSDLYSLGVVLFEVLTGRLPFTRPDPDRGGARPQDADAAAAALAAARGPRLARARRAALPREGPGAPLRERRPSWRRSCGGRATAPRRAREPSRAETASCSTRARPRTGRSSSRSAAREDRLDRGDDAALRGSLLPARRSAGAVVRGRALDVSLHVLAGGRDLPAPRGLRAGPGRPPGGGLEDARQDRLSRWLGRRE